MNKKAGSGLLGIVVGGIWFANNYQHFEEQGFVAIGMPLILVVVGAIYLVLGLKEGKSS